MSWCSFRSGLTCSVQLGWQSSPRGCGRGGRGQLGHRDHVAVGGSLPPCGPEASWVLNAHRLGGGDTEKPEAGGAGLEQVRSASVASAALGDWRQRGSIEHCARPVPQLLVTLCRGLSYTPSPFSVISRLDFFRMASAWPQPSGCRTMCHCGGLCLCRLQALAVLLGPLQPLTAKEPSPERGPHVLQLQADRVVFRTPGGEE